MSTRPGCRRALLFIFLIWSVRAIVPLIRMLTCTAIHCADTDIRNSQTKNIETYRNTHTPSSAYDPFHPHTHLWSWYPGGWVCAFAAPLWSVAGVQAEPPANAPAGTPQWPPGLPQGRRGEPLRSRPPDLHSAWFQSHKPSDRDREGQQLLEITHTLFFYQGVVDVWCWQRQKHLHCVMAGICLMSVIAWGVVIIRPNTRCFFFSFFMITHCCFVVEHFSAVVHHTVSHFVLRSEDQGCNFSICSF